MVMVVGGGRLLVGGWWLMCSGWWMVGVGCVHEMAHLFQDEHRRCPDFDVFHHIEEDESALVVEATVQASLGPRLAWWSSENSLLS